MRLPMGKREFSPAFRTFVNKYISSVEQIEVLLILLANPERSWGVPEISAILRSSPNSIASRLDALIAARLAAGNPEQGYRYAASGRTHALVEQLQDEYAARRFSVIELIFAPPDAMQSFADAFRLREGDEE
jgi:hypothetical protein